MQKTCLIVFAYAISAAGAAESSFHYGRLPMSFEPDRGQGGGKSDYLARGAGYTIELRSGKAVLHVPDRQIANGFTVSFPGARLQPQVHPIDRLPGAANYFLGTRGAWRLGVPTYQKVQYDSVYPGVDVVYYGHQGKLEYDFVVGRGADPAPIRVRFAGAGLPRLDASGDLVFPHGSDVLRQHRPVAWQNRTGGRDAVDVRYRVLPGGDVALELGPYDRKRPLIIDPVLTYSTYLGGSGNDGITSIKVDTTGALYVAGFTTSSAFRTTASAVQGQNRGRVQSPEYLGFGDAFVAKLNPAGTALVYSTYLGGSDDDAAMSLAVDAAGNAYVAGNTRSANFPVTAGAFQTKFGGSVPDAFYSKGDAFVAKLNPTGDKLLYATYVGGSSNDGAWSIAVDADGSAVVAGETLSTNFPTTANAISRTFRGAANLSLNPSGDAFLIRLKPDGSALTYGTYIGGRSHDLARGVALDAQGNAYVCGTTYSSDFPVTAGALQTTFRGVESTAYNAAADDAWVMKVKPDGTIAYSTYLGGSFRDGAFGIAVDTAGSAYVTGHTMSTNFPVSANAVQKTYGGTGGRGTSADTVQGDAFIAKLNPAGSALVYSTYFGGKADEAGTSIVLDPAGNAYVTGYSLSTELPVSADALQKTMAGYGGQGIDTGGPPPEGDTNFGDAFVLKLDPQGAIVYSSFYGGSQDDLPLAIDIDSGRNVYLAGNTVSANLPLAAAMQGTYAGRLNFFPRGDAFVARFDFGGKLLPVPAGVSFVPGAPTTGQAGAKLGPLTAQVLDAAGAAAEGITVNFSAARATVDPTGAATDAQGRASTTVTLGADTGTARVTATVAGIAPATFDLTITSPPPPPVISGVLNGASGDTTIAPGARIVIAGSLLATAPADAGAVLPLPLDLGGVKVRAGGSQIPLLAVAPGQIVAQLPYQIAPGPVGITVETGGIVSAPFQTTVLAAAPGIFLGADNRAVAQNVAADSSLSPNTPDNPVIAGGALQISFTGLGAVDNPVATGAAADPAVQSRPVLDYSVTVGGEPATVDFIGLTSGQVGMAEADIHVPDDLAAGDYPVVITIGGQASNAAVISVAAKN